MEEVGWGQDTYYQESIEIDMNLCYKVALNNYHGSKPYQMGWHDRRNDNKYREYN
jgi:hypothetical protein